MSNIEHIITWLTGGGFVAACGAIGLIIKQLDSVKALKREVEQLRVENKELRDELRQYQTSTNKILLRYDCE